MLLLGLLLLTSALAGRRHGAAAESDLSSKFAFPGAKEQNGNGGAGAEPPAQGGRRGAGGEPGPCKHEEALGSVKGRWAGGAVLHHPCKRGTKRHWAKYKHHTEAPSPSSLPPSALPLDVLNSAVAGFSTVEELIRYLEPDRWQLDLEDLYRPTWQLLGKAYIHGRKSRVVDLNLLKEEVRLYSCTPRNFSVSLREELKRTDTIFWPLCLLVKRCGGNCACCHQNCNECQCIPTKVTKKYHEVLQLKPRTGVRGLHKSLTDVPLEHHEECDCVCKGNTEG
uniref:Platelet derived growth factor C n=1 Tax=Pavo cristatus TaxID=9049 RepID=A0A8C9ELJ1_PAVCR